MQQERNGSSGQHRSIFLDTMWMEARLAGSGMQGFATWARHASSDSTQALHCPQHANAEGSTLAAAPEVRHRLLQLAGRVRLELRLVEEQLHKG